MITDYLNNTSKVTFVKGLNIQYHDDHKFILIKKINGMDCLLAEVVFGTAYDGRYMCSIFENYYNFKKKLYPIYPGCHILKGNRLGYIKDFYNKEIREKKYKEIMERIDNCPTS